MASGETSECDSDAEVSDTIIEGISPTSPAADAPTLEGGYDVPHEPKMELGAEEVATLDHTTDATPAGRQQMEFQAEEVVKEDIAETSTSKPKTKLPADVVTKQEAADLGTEKKPLEKPNGATLRRWVPNPANKHEVALRKMKDDKNRRESARKARKAAAFQKQLKPAK